MNQHDECPECGKAVALKYRRCECGWRRSEELMAAQDDHGCQYEGNGRRCRLPGSMSHSTHGNGKWYCKRHYHSLGNPKEGEECLDYIEKHFDEIMDELVDWRRKLHQ